MPYTDTGITLQKLSLISGHAHRDDKFQFTSLVHLLNEEYLRDCYRNLNRNKAVGIDKVNWEEYGKNLEENIGALVSKLKRSKYKPEKSKRVYIPKNEKERRPIGISTIETKVVEKGTPQGSILSPILANIYLHYVFG